MSTKLKGNRLDDAPREAAGGDLATPPEVAEFLHTTEGALAQDRHAGKGVPYIKYGRRVLYRWADVAAYLESNRVDPGAR